MLSCTCIAHPSIAITWLALADYVPGGDFTCQIMQIGFC